MGGIKKYDDCDFSGWATKNNLTCSDGVVIRKGAFSHCNGKKVPMYWDHQHDSPSSCIGHAYLQEKDEGMYAYAYFNNTSSGRDAKETVMHGDIDSISIFAYPIKKERYNVVNGDIREISLVMAGANPGAKIESAVMHGMPMLDSDDAAIIYTGESIAIKTDDSLLHNGNPDHNDEDEERQTSIQHKDDPNTGKNDKSKGMTVEEAVNSMNDEQKAALGIIVQEVANQVKEEYEKGGESMAHSIFENNSSSKPVKKLSKEDMEVLISDAKRTGSMREAIKQHLAYDQDQDDVEALKHAIDITGMTVPEEKGDYGVNGLEYLMPDSKSFTDTPQFVSRDMGWVSKVMSRVHHTPFSKVKTIFADITEDEARAKGYIKGNQKKEEIFTLLKRETLSQMIYKKQALDQDDIIDLSASFDIVPWIRAEMKVMFNEEKARAILMGDGRPGDSPDKIKPDRIRPIITDDPLFNRVVKITIPSGTDKNTMAQLIIDGIIRARGKLKSTGKPDFWANSDYITEMLLLKNGIGETIYKTDAMLATTLRVNEIIEVEPMEGFKVSLTENGSVKEYPLVGTITYLGDYNVGHDPKGRETMFDDFDIDFNKQKYLLEEKLSGALVRPYSALTIVLDIQSGSGTYSSRSSSSSASE